MLIVYKQNLCHNHLIRSQSPYKKELEKRLT